MTRKTPWKPPVHLLALDLLGLALLTLGLLMQFSPDTALARALPATARLPLLIVGGLLLAVGWIGLARSVMRHHRDR